MAFFADISGCGAVEETSITSESAEGGLFLSRLRDLSRFLSRESRRRPRELLRERPRDRDLRFRERSCDRDRDRDRGRARRGGDGGGGVGERRDIIGGGGRDINAARTRSKSGDGLRGGGRYG